MNTYNHKPYLLLKSLLLSAGVAWGVGSIGVVSAGTIAQTPLFITSSLDPNILFILDDSGSMEWSFLPDGVTNLKANKRGKSATINTAYYDPTITYTPPMYSDGTSLGNASFTSAWVNGYASLPTHGGTSVNLSTSFRPTWTNATDYADTAQAAYYYQFDSTSPYPTNCTPGDQNDDDCYVKVVISTAEKQNFANWYSYYQTRIMMAKAGISIAFAQLGNTPRVGYGRIHKTTSSAIDGANGATVNTVERGVRAFVGTDRTAFFTWLFARTAANATPLRRALDSAGLYYSNQGTSGAWSSTPGVSGGALLACRQSYTILMTDGYWNDAAAATTGATKDNDSSLINNVTITGPNNPAYSYAAVSPFKDNASTSVAGTLADVAMYYWKRDLCPTIANRVPPSTEDPAFWQHMVTFGIGLGVPTTIVTPDVQAILNSTSAITWKNPNTDITQARIDDLLHAAVNSRGGFFNAKTPADFATALTSTLSKIIDDNQRSASAVAANSTQLNTGTRVFQAMFDPKDWSGRLQSFSVDTGTPATSTTTAIASTGALSAAWTSTSSTFLLANASRNIYTYNPSITSGPQGVPFTWDTSSTPTLLNVSQQTYLNALDGTNDSRGMLRLNWLRGDDTHEQKYSSGIFRNRTNVLGDIIDSDPIYVANLDYGYSHLPSTEGTSYTAFRASSSYINRRPMLYVGANDGMLHGFDGNTTATALQEIFAYVPNALFPDLSKLTSPTYSHQYYVDGLSGVGDVYFDSVWHTLLAGTTGAGGRAVFALDVTYPDDFADSTKAPSKVLWEFTNATNPDLGYTLPQPSVVRIQDGHWVVLVANGYNSDNGHAVLFVLDAKSGAVLKKIDATGGTSTLNPKNGLSSPLAVDTNNDFSVDTVYAGDLYGNLWKFDLSGDRKSTRLNSSHSSVSRMPSSA